jgi:soluble lytic murein transglycosylase-like protein
MRPARQEQEAGNTAALEELGQSGPAIQRTPPLGTGEPERRLESSPTRVEEGPNALLFERQGGGAGEETAFYGKVPTGAEGSRQMANEDRARLAEYQGLFEEVGSKFGLPPALLAGMASRETRGGSDSQLGADGYSRWDGQGYGLLQVDKRFHSPEGGPRSREHLEQAAGILADFVAQMEREHPDWPEAERLQAAVAAYNAGRAGPRGDLDRHTQGGDYSGDVWVRAQELSGDSGKDDPAKVQALAKELG